MINLIRPQTGNHQSVASSSSQVDILSAVCYTKTTYLIDFNEVPDTAAAKKLAEEHHIEYEEEKNYNFIYYDNCGCLTP